MVIPRAPAARHPHDLVDHDRLPHGRKAPGAGEHHLVDGGDGQEEREDPQGSRHRLLIAAVGDVCPDCGRRSQERDGQDEPGRDDGDERDLRAGADVSDATGGEVGRDPADGAGARSELGQRLGHQERRGGREEGTRDGTAEGVGDDQDQGQLRDAVGGGAEEVQSAAPRDAVPLVRPGR